MLLSVLLTAVEAATCTLPTGKAFLVGCGAGATLNGGATCKLSCLKYYRPTIASIACPLAGGTVTPSTSYVCVPIQQNLYPWQPAYCASVLSTGVGMPAYTAGLLGSAALVAAGEYSLTTAAGTTDKGVYYFGPMRTRGRRSAIELQFSTKSPAGGDGFWAFVSSTVPVAPSGYTKPALDPGTIFAVELDFFTDSAQSDPTGNHIAVLFGASETHGTILTNLAQSVSPVQDSLYHTTNVLIQPVSTSGAVTITVWYDGNTVARDVIASANVPAALGNLILTRSIVYVGVLSYTRATAGLRVTKAVQMCGVEKPQYWHRLYVPAGQRVRTCAQVTSFGNPDAARPGVWKPFPCPAGVPARAAPIAPFATPA